MQLYHLRTQRTSQDCLGQTIDVSWATSYYWQQKLEDRWVKDFPPLPEVLRQVVVGGLALADIEPLLRHGKWAAELLKEYVFEEVRAAEFAALPSRKKCLYGFSTSLDPHEYARMLGMPLNGRSILRIRTEAGTRVHFADASVLNCNLLLHQQLAEQARKYWAGTEPGLPTAEALVEGRVTICEIVR